MNERERLIDLYKFGHDASDEQWQGWSLGKHVPFIKLMFETHNVKNALDFGCGKGYQYHYNPFADPRVFIDPEKIWGFVPECYDPGVEMWQELPDGPFDAVICTDVMEHIPENHVQEELEKIFARATKCAYFNISCRPAYAILKTGENAHCTVKPSTWWDEQIAIANKNNIHVETMYEGEGL